MSLVIRQDRDGCATLTLNRPDKLNALNVQLFEELHAHVDALAGEHDSIGAVVLRGAGKCFSAGHDLADIAGEGGPMNESETIRHLSELPQVVIAAVHGHCYTGALELALGADLIVAADSAKFADTHARWAVTPIWGMSQRLPRRVGLSKAREMSFTGRTYGAAEAEAMHLVNFRTSDELFDAEVQKLTREILANSWFTHAANKRLLRETDGMSIADGLRHEVEHTAGTGPDMQRRIAAFLKKA
ncbi:MAG: enoyl-CoA hydratase/isomerase family protein [Rhodospirillaceae bacterium]|nr:MAG: enoyl-CoA hydratase/isomerase family protein [Rhodospirillaceae bacterium]